MVYSYSGEKRQQSEQSSLIGVSYSATGRKQLSTLVTMTCRLQEWAGDEGAIRLSSDDGPSAREFLEDEVLSDEDVDDLSDDPLSRGQTSRTTKDALLVDHTESPRSSTGERSKAHQDSA